jgi:hypothetical protein
VCHKEKQVSRDPGREPEDHDHWKLRLEGPDAAAAVGPGTVWFVGNTLTPASDVSNSELPYAFGTSNG